ncbi:MAG: NAD(P)-dependent alcohol dehydrogenase [archaeon]|nr:NAD(P)-dependent alcohol dehydrogenase [archaeon]
MKAIVWTNYGPPDVLQLKEVEKPIPMDNEVLVRVHAATVTAGDCELRSLKFSRALSFLMRLGFGYKEPTKQYSILGQEVAGVIEEIGKEVKLFKKGDPIFAVTKEGFGAYAEYVCLPEDGGLTIKPKNMTYEEAATVPLGGFNALFFLRKGNIQGGQNVLINGAGGSIGTAGVQLAKSFGAEVTAVDSAKKLDMLQSIGADHVIDYTQEDYTKNGVTYDVIFDVVGKESFSKIKGSLKKKGIYISANPRLLLFLRGLLVRVTSRKKIITGVANEKVEDLIFLKDLIEAGKIKAVIDRKYSLEQTVEAHKYVETGQKKGNVVITVAK